MEIIEVNVGKTFHPYGFHRDQGAYPGLLLKDRIKPIVDAAQQGQKLIEINFNDMKVVYGSFVDGAFGEYMDKYKDQFFNHFSFRSDAKPEFMDVVQRIFARHKERNFNAGVGM